MRKLGRKRGFTLVELSLSIAFISILSITIVLIINGSISTYRRGMTLNQINTEGMDLVDDIRTAIQNSPAKAMKNECGMVYASDSANMSLCMDDGAQKFVVVKAVKNNIDVDGDGNVEEGVPIYGAFCTGSYSYIWNSGYFYAENNPVGSSKAILKYDGGTIDSFRLLKIKDQRRAVCISVVSGVSGYSSGISNVFDISKYGGLSEEPEVLLSEDVLQPLALYDFSAAVPAVDDLGTASYYSVSFILGTVQGGINIMSSGNFCKTPGDYESSLENFDYCAINKFNFAAQAIGG